MRSLACIAFALALAAPVFAADKAVFNTAKGTLALELDRSDWSAIEPITGKLVFQLSEVRSRSGEALGVIKLNEPKLEIGLPDGMALVLTQVKWKSVFFPTIQVGRRYEIPFAIRMDEGFEKLVKKGEEPIALFRPGKYRLSAVIDSPVRPAWEEPPKSPFVELHQQFNCESKTITIDAAASAKALGGDEVKKAMAEAEGDLKHRIVTFYARSKVLSREDLLAAMEAAEAKARADMAVLFLSLNYPASDLAFFTAAPGSVKLTGHGGVPFFFAARPQQRLRFECDLGNVHRLRLGTFEAVLTTKKTVDVDVPRAAGIYEVYDDAHKKPWGWVLVHKDTDAATGLRPDTRELSAKIVDALIKQDAKALQTLAAPGFRAADVLKSVRFKLGEGDVRYFESTGTSSKVKTRLKINVAAKDKEPVFARELWLDFVLVGDELKLTHAKVWEAGE
jgi:hypothetical protein